MRFPEPDGRARYLDTDKIARTGTRRSCPGLVDTADRTKVRYEWSMASGLAVVAERFFATLQYYAIARPRVEHPTKLELVVNLRPRRHSASRSRHRFCCAPIRSSSETAVTCPACGQEERQDRKRAHPQRPPGGRLTLTLHHECPAGHAWHGPLVIRPGVRPAPCDCEAEA